MGFGLLFIGYFFMLFIPLSELGLFPSLGAVGCVIMLFGLKKLITYCPDCRTFKYALPPLGLLFVSTLISFILDVIKNRADVLLFKELTNVSTPIILCIYSAMLFVGIFKLSKMVGLPKLATRARRMLTITAVYGILALISGIFKIIFQNASNLKTNILALLHYSDFAAYLFEHIFLFLSLALIFTCYIRICLEGDEDMAPRNKSEKKVK